LRVHQVPVDADNRVFFIEIHFIHAVLPLVIRFSPGSLRS
jgi:hypothetical protein